jgi:hypothetical protein
MAVSFTECQAEHVGALHAFWQRMYRPDYVLVANKEVFCWQFGRRDNRPGFNIKLALIDGEIMGCLGYIPVEVSIKGQVRSGCWTANWMVDPEQRRLGMGPLLMRELTQQFDVTLVVGLSKDARALLPRMGFADLGELDRYVCVLDPVRAAALLEGGSLEWPDAASKADCSFETMSVRRVESFDSAATELWDRLLGREMMGTRRTADFLNWRYAMHPVFRHRLFVVESEGSLRGLAVYRVEQARGVDVRVGRLLEFVAEPEAADALLGAVLSDARDQQVSVVDFFTSAARFETLLTRHGFLRGDHPLSALIPLLFQPIDRRRSGIAFMAHSRSVPAVADRNGWYVTKSDGDQDRPN